MLSQWRWRLAGDGAGRRLILAVLLLVGGTAKAPALSVRLANGVTLQTVHPANAELISIRLLVPAGGRNDPRGSEGLAHYVEHLLASDPGPLQSVSNAPRLSAHGNANAFTSPTATVYVMDVPPESLELGLETLAERLSRLDAGAEMAARELRIVRQEYAMTIGRNPGRRLMDELRTKLERSDPALGWSIGTPETIKTFDLAAARAFFERWYRPETMTLVLSGPIEVDTVKEIAERTIGRIPHDSAPPPQAAPSPSVPAPITAKREDPDAAVPVVLRSAFAQSLTQYDTAISGARETRRKDERRKVFRRGAPLAASCRNIKDCIHHCAKIERSRPSDSPWLGKQWRNRFPAPVSDVNCVTRAITTMLFAGGFGPRHVVPPVDSQPRRKHSGQSHSPGFRSASQAQAGSREALWREHAAMFALQLVLNGAKEGPKGLVSSLRDGNDKITALSLALTRLDRRWLELTMALEADPAADPGSLADIVQARLARLSARDVPDTVLKQIKDAAGQAWKAAEDAGSADAVIGWLRMGFSLAERAQFVDALARVEVRDIVALAHKLAKPRTSATAIILPSG